MSKQTLGRIIAYALVGIFLSGAGFRFLSAFEMGRPGYVALGILLTAATLWVSEAVPLFVTSFVVLFLSLVWLKPVMEAERMAVATSDFTSPFFSDIILLFLGGFVLSTALHKLRLDERLARTIIEKTGSSVPNLMMGVMCVTAFLSMWLSNTATAAMMLALVIPIVHRLPAGDRYRLALVLCISFAANIGGLGTPIGSPPNAIAMQYMKQAHVEPSFLTWMMIGVPGVVSMLAIAWGVLVVFFRGNVKSIEPPREESPPIARSRKSYLVLGTTLVTALGWLTGGLHGLSSGTVALIPVLMFFGTGLLDVKDLRNLSWDVLLLMGGGLCLGAAISKSGLADWIVGLVPVHDLGPYGLMVVFGVVACAMSSVMSNTATANLIMPIILGLSVEPLSPLLIGAAFACSMAMPLPVSTPPNAMAFSSGELTVAHMAKPGLLLTVVGVALSFTIGYWLWGVLGLY